MSRCCDKCGQPLPAEVRRDPPLPSLDHPAVVTIHDLPVGMRAQAKVIVSASVGYRGEDKAHPEGRVYQLSPDAVDAREGRG